MATHSSMLIWSIPQTEEPGYSPYSRKELGMTELLNNNKQCNTMDQKRHQVSPRIGTLFFNLK